MVVWISAGEKIMVRMGEKQAQRLPTRAVSDSTQPGIGYHHDTHKFDETSKYCQAAKSCALCSMWATHA